MDQSLVNENDLISYCQSSNNYLVELGELPVWNEEFGQLPLLQGSTSNQSDRNMMETLQQGSRDKKAEESKEATILRDQFFEVDDQNRYSEPKVDEKSNFSAAADYHTANKVEAAIELDQSWFSAVEVEEKSYTNIDADNHTPKEMEPQHVLRDQSRYSEPKVDEKSNFNATAEDHTANKVKTERERERERVLRELSMDQSLRGDPFMEVEELLALLQY